MPTNRWHPLCGSRASPPVPTSRLVTDASARRSRKSSRSSRRATRWKTSTRSMAVRAASGKKSTTSSRRKKAVAAASTTSRNWCRPRSGNSLSPNSRLTSPSILKWPMLFPRRILKMAAITMPSMRARMRMATKGLPAPQSPRRTAACHAAPTCPCGWASSARCWASAHCSPR